MTIKQFLNSKGYRIDNLLFMNMKQIQVAKGLHEFEVESVLSTQEKTNFIDMMTAGMATYLLGLFDLWKEEKDALPKDTYGNVKTVSKKAWIRRNDHLNAIDLNHQIGSYVLFGHTYEDLEPTVILNPLSESPTEQFVADHWFHGLCCELARLEKQHSEQDSELHIKFRQLQQLINELGTLKVPELFKVRMKRITAEEVGEKKIDLYLSHLLKLKDANESIENSLQRELYKGHYLICDNGQPENEDTSEVDISPMTHEAVEAQIMKLLNDYDFPNTIIEDVNKRLADCQTVEYAMQQLRYLKNNVTYGIVKPKGVTV